MAVDPKKYVVVKREHVSRTKEADSDVLVFRAHREIKDAAVLRLQDTFAASGLYAYGNNIQAGIEVAEHILGEVTEIINEVVDEEVLEKVRQAIEEKIESKLNWLHDVSEYFITMAMTSDQMTGKVPD